MNSLVSRLAVMAVLVAMFVGAVSTAQAATVNYYEMQSTGVSIATGITTTGPTGCASPTGTYEVELSTNLADLCALDYRYTAATNGMVYSRTYFNTAYAVDTTVTGTSYRVSVRDPSTWSFQLFHVDAGGTRTYMGTPVQHVETATSSAFVNLSGQSATVPAGSKLGIETIAVVSGGRLYIGAEDSRAVGQISGHLIVDEVVACTPDPAPTMNGGSFGGNPLDVCSAVTAGATNTITNYEVTAGSTAGDNFNDGTLDPKWTKTDIGPDVTGAPVESGGTLALSGGGADIWNAADEFTYLHQQITGDFTMEVNVQSITNTGGNVWHKSGLMARESLNGNSVNVNLMVTQANGITFENRPTTGAISVSTADAVGTAPKWIRVQRTGNSWRGWWSNDGIAWTENTGLAVNVTMPTTLYIGLAVTSHAPGILDTTVFDDFAVTGPAAPLYSGASCAGIDTTAWIDGTYNLNLTYTDSCAATGQSTAGTFDFASCVPSGVLAINPGQTLNGNPINVTSIDTSTGANGLNYRVYTGSTATGPAVDVLEAFTGTGTGRNAGWDTGVWSSNNNATPALDNGDLQSGTATVSNNTGPSDTLDLTVPAASASFLYYEASVPRSGDRWFQHTAPFDASQTELSVSFYYNMFGANIAALSMQVSTDNVAWTTEWTQNTVTNATGLWSETSQVVVDLWNGTGVSATQYRTGNIWVRWLWTEPANFGGDAAVDELRIFGPGATISSIVDVYNSVTDNPPELPTAVDTTGWTNFGTYNLELTGNDATCGTPLTMAADTFVWNSCTETATLSLTSIADPITGNVTVTATGTATGIQVGTTPAPINASGWIYVPAQDDNTTTVSFYATGTGTCGPLSASQLNVATNTMAAPLVTNFTIPATVIDTTAPLDVPVTTFTATDNLAVTGYMITESATAPLAGDAGWLGAAPTSYTVAAYGPYTLYAWAKDAAGNVSLSASAPVTISNCVEVGTVTVSITPDPGVGDITGGTTVTANLGGGATNGLVRWRTNGGAWSGWVASGSVFTPLPANFGSVDFEAMADGSCGAASPVFSVTLARTLDTRINALEPTLVAAPTQNGLTGSRTSMFYCNDKNSSGQFKVEWKLASSGVWLPGDMVTVTDGGAGDSDGTRDEAVVVLINGLTAGETYDVRRTYIDVLDGLTGVLPAVWNHQITLLAWVDQAMLHNSLRFPGTVKHSGDWGTTTGYAGGIMCSTCHEKNPANGNIKRVKAAISFPDSSLMPNGGTSAAVLFTTVTDGTSDFGDDSGAPRVSSNRVCEVCHTFDGTVDPATRVNGTIVHSANQNVVSNHYDNADCVKCHEHKGGFKASCDSCHASPPINDLTDLVKDGSTPADATGSLTVGKHVKHANDLAFACNTCHTGWETAGEMPKGGNLNLGFVTPGGNGGTYDGRLGGAYTANIPTGTSVTTGGGLTCAVYCHGAGAPQWSGSGTAVCGACHGAVGSLPGDQAGDPTGGTSLDLSGAFDGFKVGKHANHLDNSIAETGDPCALCHFGTLYADATHVDGTVNVMLRPVAVAGDNSTGGAGISAVFTPGGPGTCSSMECHGDADWDSNAPGGCTLCHGYPPNSTNNSHATGFTAVNHDSLNITPNHDDCSYCHGYKNNGSGALAFADVAGLKGSWTPTATFHQDGKVTMNGDFNATAGDDAGYNAVNGGCDAAACHGNDVTHQVGTGNAANIQLADIGPGSCGTCHDTGVGGAPVVSSANTHTKANGVVYGDCTDCHSGHYAAAGGVQIPNNATVGINYIKAGHGGIKLGGPGTDALISAKTSEAEICWGCHDALGTISEWETNNKAATGSLSYDYGSLTTSNWTTATWSSGKGRLATEPFWYKRGAIQSTHTANPAVTDAALVGTPYGHSEAPNAVADIRCSYCHDVHELGLATGDAKAGSPYLRGTWRGNPYPEDGAPQSGMNNWTLSVGDGAGAQNYGLVPRGSTSSTNTGLTAWPQTGGFWIDQNSGDPNSAITTVGQHGGLCILCHTGGVDSLDQVAGENLWVSGGNGHMNSVIGGSGTTLTTHNIFSTRKRGSGTVNSGDAVSPNPYVNMGAYSESTDRAESYRGTADAAYGYTPFTGDDGGGLTGYRGQAFYFFEWGSSVGGSIAQISAGTMSLVVDDNDAATGIAAIAAQTQSQYHTFNCGKCHNPHASRLPKLMITNCLDTQQNSWDDGYQTANTAGTPWNGTQISQWPTAQNCHRLADDHTTTTRGAGWNTVTPW